MPLQFRITNELVLLICFSLLPASGLFRQTNACRILSYHMQPSSVIVKYMYFERFGQTELLHPFSHLSTIRAKSLATIV